MQHDNMMGRFDAALFEGERARLTALSCRIVGSPAEAADVVQDCFMRWQDCERAALASPAAWLTTVVKHLSVDRLRKRAREALALRSAFTDEAVLAGSPEQALLQQADTADALARLLSILPPGERLALVLHEVLECSHADIAAALGTSSVNARQLLARARRRLRDADPESTDSARLSRELVRRFQAAIHGVDVPAMVSLLGEEQPMAVHDAPLQGIRRGPCANDARYLLAA